MGLKDLSKNSPAVQRITALGQMGEVSSIGLSFLFALLIGCGIGWWLDKKFGWAPYGFLGGLAFGLIAGVRNVIVILRKYLK